MKCGPPGACDSDSHMLVITPKVEPECQKRFQKRFDRLAGAGAFILKVPD